MSQWVKLAIGVAKFAAKAAETDEGKAALKKAGELAGKAGSASLEAGKKGVAFTTSTAQRTYQGLAGFSDSQEIGKAAQERYDQGLNGFETHVEAVKQRVTSFENSQNLILATSVARFVELYLRHKDKLNNSAVDFQVRLNLRPKDVAAFEAAQVSALEMAGGLGTAALAGAGAGATAIAGATALGTASTGVAISSLSGAAAHSAMLAWFGGGSLAAGGGGMALGTAVLGGIFVAPAMLVGAMAAARKGEQRVTQATEFAAEVDKAIAEMGLRTTAFTAAIKRMDEVQDVTERLSQHLTAQVQECERLERQGLEIEASKKQFVHAICQAALTCKSLKDVMKIPVVDEHFAVTAESGHMVSTMRQSLGGMA
ncbi:hypothetical protein [Deinococcus cavernae]|nr:hypothetical protein [Deinococcus cavernae]